MSSAAAGNFSRAIRSSLSKSPSRSRSSPPRRCSFAAPAKLHRSIPDLDRAQVTFWRSMRAWPAYEPARARELYSNLNERLATLPGVEHASISSIVPFGMFELSRKVQRAGLRLAPDSKPTTAADGLAFEVSWNSVGADYFSTVGLPVVRGRAFTEAEATQPGPKVAVIDEVLAKKLWPGR